MASSRGNWNHSRRTLFLLLLVLFCLFTPPAASAQSDPASEVILRVNWLREWYGVPPYEVDAALMAAAQAQASWCAANNHIGHDGPGGSTPDDRAQAAGYGGGLPSFAIENQAHGTASINTPELVVNMWQGDWGHLNAMISDDYEDIGVGYAEAGGYSWYVMMVGWVEGDEETEGDEGAGAYPGAAPVAVSTADESGAIYHEVQAGQAAWTIAAKYGVDLDELLALNGLAEDSVLQPGDMLIIQPAQSATETTPATETLSTPAQTPIGPAQVTASATATQMAGGGNPAGPDAILVWLAAILGIALLVSALFGSRPNKS